MAKKKIQSAVTDAIHNPDKQISPEVDLENIDKQLGNKTWDDIEGLFRSISDILANVSVSFLEIIKATQTPELAPYITEEEKKECMILARGFSTDAHNFTNDVLKLHAVHKDRSGSVSEGDLFLSFDIFERYIQLEEQLSALLIPTISRATEIIGEASQRRIEHLSSTPETPTLN